MAPQWIFFCKMAISQGFVHVVESTVKKLQENLSDQTNAIHFLQGSLHWLKNEREEAISCLKNQLDQSDTVDPSGEMILGQWYHQLNRLEEARVHFKKYVSNEKRNHDAFKKWSDINYELWEKTKDRKYLVKSFEASINGLSLNSSENLSFSLRVVSILFLYGDFQLYQTFQDSLTKIKESICLPILPQIIARGNSADPDLHILLRNLFTSVAKKHPHPVLYSLMVPLMGEY